MHKNVWNIRDDYSCVHIIINICRKRLWSCTHIHTTYTSISQLAYLFKLLHWNWPQKSTHTHTHNCFTALWNLSGTTQVSRYQKKHSLTHTHRGHQSSLSAFSIYYNPWHPPYSIHALYSLFLCGSTKIMSSNSNLRLGFCPGLTGWAATRKVKPISVYRSKR